MEIFQTLEIKKKGFGTGKFHVTRTNSVGTFALCYHKHDSVEEAEACPDIQRPMEAIFPFRKSDPIHVAAQDLYDFLSKVIDDTDDSDAPATINAEGVAAADIRERLENLGAALSLEGDTTG